MFQLIRILYTGYQYAPIEFDNIEDALERARKVRREIWMKWIILRRSDGVAIVESK